MSDQYFFQTQALGRQHCSLNFSECVARISYSQKKLKLNVGICMKFSVQKGHRVGARVLKWIWKVWCTSRVPLGVPAPRLHQLHSLSILLYHKIQLLSTTHHNLQISEAHPKFTEVKQIQQLLTFKLTKSQMGEIRSWKYIWHWIVIIPEYLKLCTWINSMSLTEQRWGEGRIFETLGAS